MVSAGSFDEIFLRWNEDDEQDWLEKRSNRRIVNPSGIWLNSGGQFKQDLSGDWNFPQVPSETYPEPVPEAQIFKITRFYRACLFFWRHFVALTSAAAS